MERPFMSKFRRGFLFLSVAAFVFWVALIYVFNRDVVVDDRINIKYLSGKEGLRILDDQVVGDGKDLVHTNVAMIDKAEENAEQVTDSTREDDQQSIRDEGTGTNEEPGDRTDANEEQSLGNDNAASRDDPNDEPVDSTDAKEGLQQPLWDSGSDQEGGDKQLLIEDSDVSRMNEEPVDSTRTDEVVAVQRSPSSATDADGTKDESSSGNARAGEAVEEEVVQEKDSCNGRYIFVQVLPRRFHVDLLRNCKTLSAWTDMCETLSNAGLGPELPSNEKSLTKTGWYSTNQFSLEVIFHNRMKQYKCLTNDSSIATAIYIPYYAGLDVAQFLWHSTMYRDIGPKELVKWLRARPEWRRMRGRDHFFVAGRISWDFRRETFNDSDWGTNLLVLPEVKRMTSLVLESTLIPDATDFAIPYPTYFHPASDEELIYWQKKMKRLRRPYLYSFAGARRPNLPNSIRDEIIDQCRASTDKCKLLECYSRGNTCYRPVNLIKLFQESVFCLQPQGDSYTRRSTFDSILTGCIPVFFHSGSAYDQYKWHLPKDHTKYSVFISETEVKKGRAKIEKVLSGIPTRKVEQMQQEVIDLIPKIMYADPRSELDTYEDAFDLTVKGVVERIRRLKREER